MFKVVNLMADKFRKFGKKMKDDAEGRGRKPNDSDLSFSARGANRNSRDSEKSEAIKKAALAAEARNSSVRGNIGFNAVASGVLSSSRTGNTMSVDNVYFRCPLIGPEVLPKNEWREKIKDYLYDQLQFEQGITACLIIKSCNRNREKVDVCVQTILTYFSNIVQNPEEEKYRKIRLSNRVFQEKVAPFEGTMELFEAAGFRRVEIEQEGEVMEYFILSNEDFEMKHIESLMDALETAEPVKLELDRNVQILSPTEAAERVEIPDEFYTLTKEEIKREQAAKADQIEKSMQLRTKAMREREEQREMKKYRYTVVRIRFPNNIQLQGTFGAYENFGAVRDYVRDHLEVVGVFSLQTAIGKLIPPAEDDTPLVYLHLVPTALLVFTWEDDKRPSRRYLKNELLQLYDFAN